MLRLIQVKLSQATVLIIDHPTKYGRPDKTISKITGGSKNTAGK